jgi:hypothetical protein
MNTQICKASLLLTMYLVLGSVSSYLLPNGRQAIGGSGGSSPAGSTTEWHYDLTARIRLLLPWLNFRNVGGGRILWTEDANGVNVLELLIGSDPTRAPRKINRWGYVSERINGPSYELTGVMTESDEKSIDQAKKNLATRGAIHNFKAIRGSVNNGDSTSAVIYLPLKTDFTYREVDALVRLIPQDVMPTRQISIPEGTEVGFLFALKGLIDESVEGYRRSGHVESGEPTQCVYVFNSTLYELTRVSARFRDQIKLGSAKYQSVIESKFQTLNTSSGMTTEFKITYGTDKPILGTPVRIVYRPKWWFEAQLHLDPVSKILTSGG